MNYKRKDQFASRSVRQQCGQALPSDRRSRKPRKGAPKGRTNRRFTMSDNTRCGRSGKAARAESAELGYYRTSEPPGGARRDRTDDLMLAKHALSQLSYGPEEASAKLVGLGRLELPTSRLSSARSNQLSYKPKPPRGSPRATHGSRGLVREERET
jgi:hypothetical protein